MQFDEYFDLKDRENCIMSSTGAEGFARRMIEWSEKDDSLMFTQFLRMNGMNESTFLRLARKFPVLAEAQEYTLSALGDRRELGALNRKYDGHTAGRVMAYYSKPWRWVEEWRSELRKANDDQSEQRITVVFEAFPSSDLVPERKVENE